MPTLTPARASAPFYAYLDADTGLTRLPDGRYLFIHPADQQMTISLLVHGYWEPWIGPIIGRLVRPGDRVLEVGANVGYYTMMLAGLIGSRGRLDSYEGNPRIAALLARSVECNGLGGFVTVHNQVAADRCGVLTFSSLTRASGGGNILEGGSDFGVEGRLDEVEAVTLDSAFPEGEIDFIRTDAEGSEILILGGAMDILARSPRIKLCVEWSPAMMATRGDVGALAGRLAGMGFKFWRIVNPTGVDPMPLSAAEAANLGHSDVLIARDLDRSVLHPSRFTSWKAPLRWLAHGLNRLAR